MTRRMACIRLHHLSLQSISIFHPTREIRYLASSSSRFTLPLSIPTTESARARSRTHFWYSVRRRMAVVLLSLFRCLRCCHTALQSSSDTEGNRNSTRIPPQPLTSHLEP